MWNRGVKYLTRAVTNPGLPTKTRVRGHKPSSLPQEQGPCVSGGCRRHRPGYPSSVVSLLSLCSSRREGAGTLRCGSGALRRRGRRLHTCYASISSPNKRVILKPCFREKFKNRIAFSEARVECIDESRKQKRSSVIPD